MERFVGIHTPSPRYAIDAGHPGRAHRHAVGPMGIQNRCLRRGACARGHSTGHSSAHRGFKGRGRALARARTLARIPGEGDRLAKSSGRATCVVGRRVEERVVPWARHAAQHAPSVPSPPHRGPTSPFTARPRHPNYPLTTCRAAPAASAQAPGFELAGGPAGAPQAPWLTQTPTARLSVGLRAPRKVRAAASTDLDPSGARPSR